MEFIWISSLKYGTDKKNNTTTENSKNYQYCEQLIMSKTRSIKVRNRDVRQIA